jgi:hypothetical protein
MAVVGMAALGPEAEGVTAVEGSGSSRIVTGALNDSSDAAFQAADDVGSWTPKNKHILSGGSQSKGRFITDDTDAIRSLVSEGLNSPNAMFLPNALEGSFRVVTDMGRVIGVKGQTFLRTIVGLDGKVINSFPVHTR